jgi:uncharacterized membrane protein
MNGLLDSIVQALRGLPPELTVFLISALPIFEIRGGVIAGLALLHLPLAETLLYGLLGNIASITPVLLFLEPISKWVHGNRFARRFLEWLFARAERKAAAVNRWGALGLTVFVSIPLPGTGAWTGSIIAVLLGMRRLPALACCYLGIVIAGLVVSLLTLGGMAGVDHLRGAP